MQIEKNVLRVSKILNNNFANERKFIINTREKRIDNFGFKKVSSQKWQRLNYSH